MLRLFSRIRFNRRRFKRQCLLLLGSLVFVFCYPLTAAILPEDRADLSYFTYSGGGVDVEIPAVSVRKQVADSVSVSGAYYVDTITSASIDVVTQASAYEEERTQTTVGLDYLSGKSTYSLGYSLSEENDYEAATYSFAVSHSVFADLTTVALGYSRGNDTIYSMVKDAFGVKKRDPSFEEEVTRQNYSLGISQIITKNWLMDFTLETITDTGYLSNPYRSIRHIDPDNPTRFKFQGELYPDTRTSHAMAVRSLYYLPYRASIMAEYRYFMDTWAIVGHQAALGYNHTIDNKWILDVGYRFYTQSAADFYSDLFPAANSQTHMARDKELSTLTSHTLNFGVTYEFTPKQFAFIKKGTINFKYYYLMVDYDDFTDIRGSTVAGEEPLYSLTASMMHLYLSLWY